MTPSQIVGTAPVSITRSTNKKSNNLSGWRLGPGNTSLLPFKYHGSELICEARGPDFQTAVIHTAAFGLAPEEPDAISELVDLRFDTILERLAPHMPSEFVVGS
jgi:hypothetical protein